MNRATVFSVGCEQLEGNQYIEYLLKALRSVSDTLIVCVGNRSEKALMDKVNRYADIIYRYDSNIDINRWKDVLTSKFDSEGLIEFDELLLMNDSVFGPLYSLETVFSELSNISADFLGLTVHGKMRDYQSPDNNSIWPRFIQTYFLLIRQPMLSSEDLRVFLHELPEFLDYSEASRQFEFVFTDIFQKKGYKWNVLIDTSDKEDSEGSFFESFILFDLFELVSRKRFPFIPKYVFDIEFAEMQIYNAGNELRKTMEYIINKTEYDHTLIYSYLVDRLNLHDLITRLNLWYIVDESKNTSRFQGKAAVFSYLYYEDLFEYSISKLENVPADLDVYIATDNDEKKVAIKKLIEKTDLGFHCILLVHKGKGRDLSALLVTFHDYLMKYEVICFVHDKKSAQMAYATVGQSFNRNSWENILNSKGYVSGVLDLFSRNPLLGYVCPPMLLHNTYFHTGIDAWTICKEAVISLADQLGVKINVDFSKNPVSLGSVFWCRTAALKPLFDYHFQFSDFPDEPMPVDGTISHAIERIFPYIAQSEGYYSGYIMSTENAADNVNFYKESLNLIMNELNQIDSVDTSTLQTTLRTINHMKKHSIFKEKSFRWFGKFFRKK